MSLTRKNNLNNIQIETHGPFSPGIVKGDYKLTVIGNPFVPLKDRVLSPAEGPRMAFDIEPTFNEFSTGSVSFPLGLIDAIDKMLEENKEALIIGKAASGKTVLSYGYGFRHQSTSSSVYYLDCKDHLNTLDVGVIRQVIESIKSKKILLIIDNVHLIQNKFEKLRRTIRNIQASSGDKPSSDAFFILYLGRQVQDSDSSRLRTYDRMEAAERVIYLHPGNEAFQAVHSRFSLRNKISPFSIPSTILERWVNDFAGDLVSFAVALQTLGSKLSDPNIHIIPDVALDNIRRRYLNSLSDDPDSYWNLILLCVMTELELVANSEMFIHLTPVSSPFSDLIKDGIVYERSIGVETKYELFHPAMGSLILRAAPNLRSRANILAEGCFRRPNSIIHILMRLYDLGLFKEAKELETIIKRPDYFSMCSASFKVQDWHKFFRILTKSAPDLFLFVEDEFHKDEHLRSLIRQLLQSPPQFISSFVRYIEKKSSYLADNVRAALMKNENQLIFLENALNRPLADLSLFFNFAKQDMPNVVEALSIHLSESVNIDILLKKMLESELHYIGSFLEYADEYIPHIARSLKTELTSQYRTLILKRAVNTQPHLLVEFLKYADNSMPKEFCEYLKNSLAQEEYRKQLLSQILSIGLGHFKLFFQYANRAMPQVAKSMSEDLLNQNNINKLVSRSFETQVSELGVFLDFAQKNLRIIAQQFDAKLSTEFRQRLMDRIITEKHLHLISSFLQKAIKAAPKTFHVVVSDLSSNDYRNWLMLCASDTPLGNLKYFFGIMDTLAPNLSLNVKEGLSNIKYLIRLRHRSLEAPLEHLASFLGYAEGAMPLVAQSIKEWISNKENRGVIIARAMRTPTKNMRGFLNYAEWELPELVVEINSARGKQKRRL